MTRSRWYSNNRWAVEAGGMPSRRSRFPVAIGAFLVGLLTMCLCQPAAATQIIVTITGTVTYGLDQTGVFGVPETDLKGKSFTLVYTFDDTKAQEVISYCSGIPCGSMTSGAGPSSPGTAVLTIGSGSFRLGVFNGGSYATSSVVQSAPPTYSTVYYQVSDYTFGFSDAVQFSIAPFSGEPPLTTDYDWRGSFSYNLQFSNGTEGGFESEVRADLPTVDSCRRASRFWAWGRLRLETRF